MKLCPVVTKEEVMIANQIFEVSTMDSLKSDFPFIHDPVKNKIVSEIEQTIGKMLPLGQKVLLKNLEEDLEGKFTDMMMVQEAIGLLMQKGILVELSHGYLKRKS